MLVVYLSVLHSFYSQFVYISLIVSLPYSFIWFVRFLLLLVCWSIYCYFVHILWKSAVFINIATISNSPLVPQAVPFQALNSV